MFRKHSKSIFILSITASILITIGGTLAYFSASITSNNDIIKEKAAEFKIELTDDTDLLKTSLIPSEEIYVDYSTIKRVDENGKYLKPYKNESGNLIKEETVCIDDNLNEICSVYTFTIKNPNTEYELPASVTIIPSVNTFKNLYFKVLDSKQNIVIPKTHLVDDRQYILDASGNKIYDQNSKISNIELVGLEAYLPKATLDEETKKVIPTEATFSIVLWIDEIGRDQTAEDGLQVFVGGIKVESKNGEGQGITAVFTAGGVEQS